MQPVLYASYKNDENSSYFLALFLKYVLYYAKRKKYISKYLKTINSLYSYINIF